MISDLAYNLLLLLNAERAHSVAKWGMKKKFMSPGPCISPTPVNMYGYNLNNRLGLAAGFDKNAELLDVIEDYGFGFIEVGSITYLGGQGNPKPRLFRLDKRNLLNRMGLNGLPAAQVVENIKKSSSKKFGVNIAKTHSPDIMGDKAIDDVVSTYKLVNELGMYNVLNVSCPNTKEGKTFEDPVALAELLNEINKYRKDVKLLVKLSPSLAIGENHVAIITNIVQICLMYNVDGFICTNTMPFQHPKFGKGGKSGADNFDATLQMVRIIRSFAEKAMIIGCGGVMTLHDAMLLQCSGADFIQAYTGFVRGPNAGTNFAHIINRGIK